MSKELLEAAYNGEIDKVKKLLDQKDVNINFVNENGDTALCMAAKNGHEDIADFLIKKNANINMKSNGGWTALNYAIHFKNIPMACFLVEKGANINPSPNKADSIPLFMAVSLQGSERLVQLLIEKGADVNEVIKVREQERFRPLNMALFLRNIQVAKLLIEKGAELTYEGFGIACEKISTFSLLVEIALKNRSKKEILQRYYNGILDWTYRYKARSECVGDEHNSQVQSLMLYLLDCGLEMPEGLYYKAGKHTNPVHFLCEKVRALFEYDMYSKHDVSDFQIYAINSIIEDGFNHLKMDGKIFCLNYRRKEDGNTWLHVAINHNPNRAAALILLGSRLDIPNNKNETVAQLIRDKPFFLILVKIKQLQDWLKERNARIKKNTTETSSLPPLVIYPPSTSLVDVKMEKDKPIINQYNMGNATAAAGTAASSEHIISSLLNVKEEIEDATCIKALNETHNVESKIRQIYDDISKIQPKENPYVGYLPCNDISKIQPKENRYVGFLLSELIVKNPDLFNSLLGFAYKFFSEIEMPPKLNSQAIFENLSREFCLANEYCVKLLSVAFTYKYQFKSENQGSKLTIVPCQNKQGTAPLEIENRKLMEKYQWEHTLHQLNSGYSQGDAFKRCQSEFERKSKILQDQQDEIEKLKKDLEKSQHENALLKMQIQNSQKTTQSVSIAGHKRKPEETILSAATSSSGSAGSAGKPSTV